METTTQQSALKVSVQELDTAGTSRKSMWISWSDGGQDGAQGVAAYDVNLLLENGRILQLAHGLPASVHELVSPVSAGGKARIQVIGVRADERGMEQGMTSWMELSSLAAQSAAKAGNGSAEALIRPPVIGPGPIVPGPIVPGPVVGPGAPVVYSIQPSVLTVGSNTVTIQGANLPLAFGYTITNMAGQPVVGTGTGFPSGSATSVTLSIFISSGLPPGAYLLRVSNQAGSTTAPISIGTLLQPPVINYLDPSIIYPDNSGPTRQLIVGGRNLPTSVSGFSVSSPVIGLSLVFPNPDSAVLALSNLQSVPSGRYYLSAYNPAGAAAAAFDIVRFF